MTLWSKLEPPNKRMQLTKLRAAPERQHKVPPCAPAGWTGGGTASQLIRSVRRTSLGRSEPGGDTRVIGAFLDGGLSLATRRYIGSRARDKVLF